MLMYKTMDSDHIVRYSKLLWTSIALMSIKSSTWAPKLVFTFICTAFLHIFKLCIRILHTVTHFHVCDDHNLCSSVNCTVTLVSIYRRSQVISHFCVLWVFLIEFTFSSWPHTLVSEKPRHNWTIHFTSDVQNVQKGTKTCLWHYIRVLVCHQTKHWRLFKVLKFDI